MKHGLILKIVCVSPISLFKIHHGSFCKTCIFWKRTFFKMHHSLFSKHTMGHFVKYTVGHFAKRTMGKNLSELDSLIFTKHSNNVLRNTPWVTLQNTPWVILQKTPWVILQNTPWLVLKNCQSLCLGNANGQGSDKCYGDLFHAFTRSHSRATAHWRAPPPGRKSPHC